ncbi:MAG: hypothetical protein UR78_C0004G0045 [Candidatus Moranbacteria bacterium GW2011_GWF2_35_39]|nr:MAG: hypothetical protein UR78_C0004G0045 [Candidatus Moranbacteria bacterium GW2011_GWF2_35_39]
MKHRKASSEVPRKFIFYEKTKLVFQAFPKMHLADLLREI